MSDTDYLLARLARGPATTNEILSESFRQRGCGLTVHSRAADLRRRGVLVRCQVLPGRNGAGRREYQYSLEEPA